MRAHDGNHLDREQILEDALVREYAYWTEYLANCDNRDQADNALEHKAIITAAVDAPLPEEAGK